MEGGKFVYSFDFHDDNIVDEQVQSITTIEMHIFVDKRQRFLLFNLVTPLYQFKSQTCLVSRFEQTWA